MTTITGTQRLAGTARNLAIQGLLAAAKAKVAVDLRHTTPTGERLLRVIERCLKDDFNADDLERFARAEARRTAMLGDESAVTMVDFGAGAHDDNRSVDEMSSGVIKHKTVSELCRGTSKKPRWARLLYALIAEYRPALALELGTSVGVSATYQGVALAQYGGRLVTVEGSPQIAAIAQASVDSVGLGGLVDVLVGRFSDVLPSLLMSVEPLDYVFVDGHHDEHATQEYHALLKPHLASGAVLVYDDIHWSPGMKRAWAAISADPDLCVTVDLNAVGIAVLGEDKKRSYNYQLRGTH